MTWLNPDEKMKLDFEKSKLIYDKSSELHKHYISWRNSLLTGYFAIIAALFLTIYTLIKDNLLIDFAPYVAFGLAAISIIFWLLDKRNEDLYHSCQETAQECEKDFLQEEISERVSEERLKNISSENPINETELVEESTKIILLKKGPYYRLSNSHNTSIVTHKRVLLALYFFMTFASIGIGVLILKNKDEIKKVNSEKQKQLQPTLGFVQVGQTE